MEQVEIKKMKEMLGEYFLERGLSKFWALFYQISDSASERYYNKRICQMELNCPAIAHLSTKNDLNHRERTALLMLYLCLGEDGERRLWEILKQQKNFKPKICESQINNYKKKGYMKGISCEKLGEWNICSANFSDCHKFKEVLECKN